MNQSASPWATFITFVLVIAAIGGGAILVLSSRPEAVQITINPPVPTATPAPTSTPGPIQIYVTGAVNNPESIVILPYNSRVTDAIEAAGGFTESADITRINLAGFVRDGDQVHVWPLISTDTETGSNSSSDETSNETNETSQPTSPENPPTTISSLLNINQATTTELQSLPGIGPALAERIVAYRETNGPFRTLDDLDNVSGIGPALLSQLEPLITFGDQTNGAVILATPSGGERLNINLATATELQNLPGIGPALAERIVAYRETNGPFRTLDDLDNVSGIGPAILTTLADLIRFD